jgi:probable O-glycosylation ligase (exosortase A-associated)
VLRSIFVLVLSVVGLYYALQEPFYALLVYLAYAYFRPEQWLWTNIIPPYFSFALGAYVILTSLFSGQRLIINKRIALIGILVVHSFLSILFSEYFAYGWIAWTNFFRSILITYCVIVLVTDFSKLRVVFLILVLFLGVEAAKQGWVYLITSPGHANTNGIPFLGDNNCVAVGMLMLVPVIALLAQTTQRRGARFGFWVLLIGVLYRALSTYSRGGFLACLVMGVTYGLRSRQKLRALFGMAIVVGIVLWALPEQYWGRMGTITLNENEEEQDRSAGGRIHFWKVAVAMGKANPVLGIGHNCYNAAYDTYDFLQGRYGRDRSVHSSFFGVLAEWGYVGAVLYGLVIFSALRSCRRVYKLTAQHPTLLHLSQSAAALETGLVVFIVGGSFLPFQYNEMVWHYIGFTIVLEGLATQYVAASEHPEGQMSDVAVIDASVS